MSDARRGRLRRLTAVVAVSAALAALLPLRPVPVGAATSATYANPVWSRDFPDPSVLRVGTTYYAYGTNRGANVQTLRSTDLVTWTWVGDALPVLPAWAAPGWTWAPSVLQRGNRFVLYYSAPLRDDGRHCVSRALSNSPTGPFVDQSAAPFVCQLERGGSIDPSPFVDDDGAPWLLWKSEGVVGREPTHLWAQRLSDDGASLLPGQPAALLSTDQPWEGNVIENPSMVRHGGSYHLFYSANEWNSADYAVGHAVCASPAGPCAKRAPAPLFGSGGGVAGPGGPFPFRAADGSAWLAYHGWSPSAIGYPAGARSLRVTKLSFLDGGVALGPREGGFVARAARVAGGDRFATAAALSARSFAAGVPVAYVANGEGFADALAGAPAARRGGGPVLLVSRNGVPAATASELARLRPQSIVVLGGGDAVTDSVEQQLRTYTAGTVTRLSGADRYATAAAASSAFQAGVPVVYVATGEAFPDALVGSAAASSQAGAVLLVRPDEVPPSTVAALDRLQPKAVVVLGGPAAVSDGVEQRLRTWASGNVRRLAGPDRYATSAAVSAAAFTPSATDAFIATGTNFPDALAAGAVGRPVLLVAPRSVPEPVRRELDRLAPAAVPVLGGPAAVDDLAFTAVDLR